MLLNAELLLHYQRCDRRVFLDVYGNPTQMDALTDFLVKLQSDRLAYQQSVVGEYDYHRPQYPKRDWRTGAEATLELMRQGVECIHQGVLLATVDESIAPSPQSVTLLCRPDLLVKQPGKSNFGDWVYVPEDIHFGKRPKLDYQIVAACHAWVLASVQGSLPETARLILRDRKPYRVNLEKVIPQMLGALTECIQMLQLKQEPEVFISRQRCNLCRWYSSCYAIARDREHLSLLPGVTPSRYDYLKAVNLTTVESLANANPAGLEPAIATEVGEQLVRQARSTQQQRPILTPKAAIDLPTAPIEIYFDIEAQQDLDLDYLLGVLIVDGMAETAKFYPFLAERPEDEGAIWSQFLDLVSAYPDAPIFHFCDYEVETVKRLAKRYHTPRERVIPLLTRFVDIHAKVTQAVTLPIEGYALKQIARWLGFEWRDPKANGQLCIYWYDRWLETNDRSFLEAIVRYNEDDCRATFHVKDWLVNLVGGG